MKKILLACIVFILTLSNLNAQTSWKGTISSNWTTASNWTAGVPVTTVDAIIGDANFTGAFQPVISTSTANCKSLTVGAGIIISSLTVSRNINISGNLNIGSNGTVNHNAASNIIITGNWINSGVYTSTSTGSVRFSGISQNITGATTFLSVIINAGSTVSLSTNISINTSLSIAGTLDLMTYTADRPLPVSGSIVLSGVGKLKIGGTNGFPANYNTNTFSSTSTVEYYGTNQNVAAKTYGNLTFSSSSGLAVKIMPATAFIIGGNFTSLAGSGSGVTFTAANNITVNGTVNLDPTTTFNAGSFNHLFKGNWLNDGNFNGNTSTVNFNGTNSIISGTGTNSFYSLNFSAAGISALGSTTIYVSGNLSTSGAGVFTHNSGGTLSMNGTVQTINGSGFKLFNLIINATATLNNVLSIAGDFTVNGSFTATANTVTMNGSTQIITGSGTIGFNSINIQGMVSTVKSFTVNANFTVAAGGSFDAFAGTITMTGTGAFSGTANFYNITINSGKTLTLAGNSVLRIGNVFTKNGVLNVTTNVPNTVEYNAPIAQTIVGTTYYNLILSNNGTKTAAAGFSVNNDLTINSGVTFSTSSYSYTIKNNFTNDGMFNSGTSTISFTGNPATIGGINTSAFYNLIITSTGNINLSSPIDILKDFTVDGMFSAIGRKVNFSGALNSAINGTVSPVIFYDMEQNKTAATTTLNVPVEITGNLILTDGIIYTSTVNLLTLDNNVSSSTGSNTCYIDGPLKKKGNQAFSFPVGNGGYLRPISISSPVSTSDEYTAQYVAADPAPFYSVYSKDLSLDHVSRCEYWLLDRGDACPDVNVTLSWNVNSCGVTSLIDLKVAQWDGIMWKDFGNGGTTGTTTAGTIESAIPVSSYGPFTLGSPTGSVNPLPIELLNFKAIVNKLQVDISWETYSENGNSFFTIEKSKDGSNFENVIDIKGAGSSNTVLKYYTIDKNPLIGTSFYRLKQTDFSGNYRYSGIVSVQFKNDFGFTVFPNPSNSTASSLIINGTASDKIHLVLFDNSCKEVFSSSYILDHSGVSTVMIEPSQKLSKGIYMVLLKTNEKIYKQKLIIE